MTRAYQDMDTMTTFTDAIVSVTLACGVGGTLLALLLFGGVFFAVSKSSGGNHTVHH